MASGGGIGTRQKRAEPGTGSQQGFRGGALGERPATAVRCGRGVGPLFTKGTGRLIRKRGMDGVASLESHNYLWCSRSGSGLAFLRYPPGRLPGHQTRDYRVMLNRKLPCPRVQTGDMGYRCTGTWVTLSEGVVAHLPMRSRRSSACRRRRRILGQCRLGGWPQAGDGRPFRFSTRGL